MIKKRLGTHDEVGDRLGSTTTKIRFKVQPVT